MSKPTITCPRCRGGLRLRDDNRWGTRIRCPNCQQVFVAENPSGVKQPAQSTAVLEQLPEDAFLPLDADEPTSQPAPAAPVVPVAPFVVSASDHSATAQLHAYRRRQRKQRHRGYLVGGVVAVATIGVGWWLVSQGGQRSSKNAANSHQGSNVEAADAKTPQSGSNSPNPLGEADNATENHARVPISLKYVPAGCSLLVHLHPARLWAQEKRREEFRRCLEPLVGWGEETVKQVCPFAPSEIEEALFCVVFREKEAPVDLGAVLHFAGDYDPAGVRTKFPGRESVDAEHGVTLIAGDKFCVLLVDPRTLAIAPAESADELLEALSDNAVTSPAIEGLLPHTDATRDITLIFQPDELRDRSRHVLPREVDMLLERVCLWLSASTEAAAFSIQLGEPFFCELVIRHRQADERGTVSSQQALRQLKEQLARVPGALVSSMKTWQPPQAGVRRVVGRFPAMMKAVATLARDETGPRWIRLSAALPERAAPNLALAGILTWREWTRPHRTSSPSVSQDAANDFKTKKSNATPPNGDTPADRLNKPIDVDFRGTPLEEAFNAVGEQTGVKFTLDGKALEAAGFTRNMPQEFKSTGKPALAVVARILKQYSQMVIVLDETAGIATVTTEAAARDKGQSPLKFDAPPP